MSKITRRDLIHGALTAPPALMASGAWADRSKSTYPPELTGLRGSHSGSFEVDVSELKPGLYLLRVITENGTSVSRFIKQ